MANANLGFKLGTQENLDKLLAQGTVTGSYGTFYLTSDTSRLYVGNADNKIVPVNAGIITVDRMTQGTDDPEGTLYTYLPSEGIPGHYYYITKDNILCVYNGQKWVQINSVVSNSKVETYATTHKIELEKDTPTTVTTMTTNVVDTLGTQTAEYHMVGSNGITIDSATKTINDKNVDIVTFSADPIEVLLQQAIKTEETPNPEDPEGDPIIKTTELNGVTVSLDSDLMGKKNNFNIIGGSNVTINKDSVDDNNIIISSENSKVESFSSPVPQAGEEGFTINLKTSDKELPYTATITPEIAIGSGSEKETYGFTAGVATLPVYTQTEVNDLIEANNNSLLEAINAMTYKGVIENDGASLPDKAKLGDTYLIGSTGYTIENEQNEVIVQYAPGTLLIAFGEEEDTDGFIKGTIEWQYVAGTGNTDTLYYLYGIADGIQLVPSNPSAENDSNVFKIVNPVGDDSILLKYGNTTGNQIGQTLEISHGVVPIEKASTSKRMGNINYFTHSNPTEQTPDNDQNHKPFIVTAISGIELANGHITKIETTDYELTNTITTFGGSSYEVTSSETDKSVSVKQTLELIAGDTTGSKTTPSFNLKTDTDSNINIAPAQIAEGTTTTNTIVLNLVWGSFDPVQGE